jgi:high frequency lysogenization protein
MEQNDKNRTIALAAVFQASGLVRKLAHEGSANRDDCRTMVNSLFNNEVDSIEEVYGGLANLRSGFTLLSGLLTNPGQTPEAVEITRYSIGLLHLQAQLAKNPAMGEKIIKGITEAERQKAYFDDVLNPALLSRLADTYQDTISTLGPRIMVKGEQEHLSNNTTATEIRAMLLSGIRAAVLWKQAGGSKFKLMLKRRKMVETARYFLNHC